LQRRSWLWAGWWTFCAILIRLQGVALIIPLVYMIWSERPWDKKIARGVALALPIVALGLYLFVRAAAGESNVVPTSEPDLFARIVPPWENYFYAMQTLVSGKFQLADVFNFIITTVGVIVLIVGWRKMPRTFALYVATSVVVLTMRLVETQPLNSMTRYSLTLVPIFILLGLWGKNVWIHRAIVYTSFALALFFSAQFVMWGWVG
jgi:hypothetical protein